MSPGQIAIVQVIDRLDPGVGGPARNAFELNLALNESPDARSDLFWLHGTFDRTVAAEFVESGGTLPNPGPRRIGRSERGGDISVSEFIATIRYADALIIHGYYSAWSPILTGIARHAGTAVLLTPHGSLGARQQRYSRARKAVFEAVAGRRLRRSLAAFVVGSRSERDDLVRRFPGSRVTVAGVGTLMHHDPRKDGTSPALGPARPLTLLALSRVAPKKRIDLSIRALAVLRRRGIDAELTIAGHGDSDLLAELGEIAVHEGVGAHTTFTGEVLGGAKRALLARADFLLAPSEEENFGIVAAEALASGTPVIASSGVAAIRGVSPEVVRVVEPCTPERIADAVAELAVGDPSSRSRLARNEAERVYSWGPVAERWISAARESIEALVARGRPDVTSRDTRSSRSRNVANEN